MSNEQKKQTAVDYLLLTLYGLGFIEDIDDVFVQQIKNEALQMEREQIEKAHIFAQLEHGNGMIMPSEDEQEESARNYYQQAYGK